MIFNFETVQDIIFPYRIVIQMPQVQCLPITLVHHLIVDQVDHVSCPCYYGEKLRMLFTRNQSKCYFLTYFESRRITKSQMNHFITIEQIIDGP